MNYALFGDSHAQVVFPLLIDKLEERGHNVVVSKPRAGWTTKKHLQNGMASLLLSQPVDVLVLSLGGNNHDLSPSYGDVITQVLDLAQQTGVKDIYWISPAWATRNDVQIRHEWTSEYLKANLPKRVRFIDIRPITKTGHQNDGVHFTREKYKEWADYVGDKILRNRAITQIPKSTWWISGSFIIIGLSLLLWKRK
jgi:hypothetical protein